jgi:hypothetical protein
MRPHEEVRKPKPKGTKRVDDVFEPPGPPDQRPDFIGPSMEEKDPPLPRRRNERTALN